MGGIELDPNSYVSKTGNKGWLDGTGMESIFPKLPWMDQMGLTALITMAVIILVSYINEGAKDEKGINLPKGIFKTYPSFNIGAFAIMLILTVIYSLLW